MGIVHGVTSSNHPYRSMHHGYSTSRTSRWQALRYPHQIVFRLEWWWCQPVLVKACCRRKAGRYGPRPSSPACRRRAPSVLLWSCSAAATRYDARNWRARGCGYWWGHPERIGLHRNTTLFCNVARLRVARTTCFTTIVRRIPSLAMLLGILLYLLWGILKIISY